MAFPPSWRRVGSLQSVLQQAHHAAQLDEVARSLPSLSCSKPLLLLQQLHPLVLFVTSHTGTSNAGIVQGGYNNANCTGVSTHNSEDQDTVDQLKNETFCADRIAAAAAQLRRLMCLDDQHAANASLLLWMLLFLAIQTGAPSVAGEKRADHEQQGENSSRSGRGPDKGPVNAVLVWEHPVLQREPPLQGSTLPSSLQNGEAMTEKRPLPAAWTFWRLSAGTFLLLVKAMGWGSLLQTALHVIDGLDQQLLVAMDDLPQHEQQRAGMMQLRGMLLAHVAERVVLLIDGGSKQGNIAATEGCGGHKANSAAKLVQLELLSKDVAADIDLLQQELLTWQDSAIVHHCLRLLDLERVLVSHSNHLLEMTQQPGWGLPHQQHLQRICQLRARLGLLLAHLHAVQPAQQAQQGICQGSQQPAVSAESPGVPRGGWLLDVASDACTTASTKEERGHHHVSAWSLSDAALGECGLTMWRAVLEVQAQTTCGSAWLANRPPAPTIPQRERAVPAEEAKWSVPLPLFMAAHVTAWELFCGDVCAPRSGLADGVGADEVLLGRPAACDLKTFSWQPPQAPFGQPVSLGYTTRVAALPGVVFSPPLPPYSMASESGQPFSQPTGLHSLNSPHIKDTPTHMTHPHPQSAASSCPVNSIAPSLPPAQYPILPAALSKDPSPLSLPRLAVSSICLAQRMYAAQPCEAELAGSGPALFEARAAGAAWSSQPALCNSMESGACMPVSQVVSGGSLDEAAAWGAGNAGAARAAVWLAHGAAAGLEGRAQQQALLQLLLSSSMLSGLRQQLEGDAVVRQWCERGLVALSNRMSDDGSSVQVWGDERQRVSILIQGILPWAMLAPEACIERLTLDALTQTGQVASIVEALSELPSLASYTSSTQHGHCYGLPALTRCLCACLDVPHGSALPPTGCPATCLPAFKAPEELLESPPTRRAFLSLAQQLCAANVGPSRQPLVHPGHLLRHAVLPVLWSLPSQHHDQWQPHPALTLALQLGCGLLPSSLGQGPPPHREPRAAFVADSLLQPGPPLLITHTQPLHGSELIDEGPLTAQGCLAAQLLYPLVCLLDVSRRKLPSPSALLIPLPAFDLGRAFSRRVLLLLLNVARPSTKDTCRNSGARHDVLLGTRPCGGGVNPQAAAAAKAAAECCVFLPNAWQEVQSMEMGMPIWRGIACAERQISRDCSVSSPTGNAVAEGQQCALAVLGQVEELLQLCAVSQAAADWAMSWVGQQFGVGGSGALALGRGEGSTSAPDSIDAEPPAAHQAAQLMAACCQLPLGSLRQSLVGACASLLPVLSWEEARRVLGAGALLVVAARVAGEGRATQGGAAPAQIQSLHLHCAVLEVACRAVRVLALHPSSCPIADVVPAAVAATAVPTIGGLAGPAGPAPAAALPAGPSPLRRVAVDRAMRHVAAFCQLITDADMSGSPTASSGMPGPSSAHHTAGEGSAAVLNREIAAGSSDIPSSISTLDCSGSANAEEGQPSPAGPGGTACRSASNAHSDAEAGLANGCASAAAPAELRGALGVTIRCFREVASVCAAVQLHYPCIPLQTCLLHLLQVMNERSGGRPSESAQKELLRSASTIKGTLGETLQFALNCGWESARASTCAL